MKYIHSSKFPFASKADKEFLLHGFNDVLINVTRIDECLEGIYVTGFIEVSYFGVFVVEGVHKYEFNYFVPLHRIHEVYRSLLITDPHPYERDFSDKMIIDDCGAIATECNSLLNDQTPPLADFINMCERGKALKEELGN